MTALSSALPIRYSEHNSAPQKLLDHIWFLLPQTIARTINDSNEVIEHHPLETLANKLLSWVPTLPRAVTWVDESTKDPKILLIAFTTFTLFSINFMIYPIETLGALKWTHDLFLDKIPASHKIKFWSHIALSEIVIGLALRAAGRIYNKKLFENFYENKIK